MEKVKSGTRSGDYGRLREWVEGKRGTRNGDIYGDYGRLREWVDFLN